MVIGLIESAHALTSMIAGINYGNDDSDCGSGNARWPKRTQQSELLPKVMKRMRRGKINKQFQNFV